MNRFFIVTCFVISFVLVTATGCPNATETPKKKTTAGDDHAGHDHSGHDHGHSHASKGPNGGHILELGEEEYHAEWLHDDATGKVTVVLLDSAMKKEVAIAASEIAIDTKIGDAEKSYALTASNPTGDDMPKASRFEVTDPALVVALGAAGTEGTTATLKLEIEGKPFSAPFKQDTGHHH